MGLGSLLALSWPEMYMSEGARLWGLARISSMAAGWSDPDVASKMLNAWVGMGNGFLQIGGYPLEIGWAMMRPEYNLSASFKGREVTWANDTAGQWVVDSSGDNVANFNASLAEDMGLSQGTVENLDDLMFLMGYREYDEAESGKQMVEKYVPTGVGPSTGARPGGLTPSRRWAGRRVMTRSSTSGAPRPTWSGSCGPAASTRPSRLDGSRTME